MAQTSEVYVIFSWEANRESECETDDSLGPSPSLTYVEQEWLLPQNKALLENSLQAMGDARAREAAQRLMTGTHTRSEREQSIKERPSAKGKQLSGSK